MQNILFKIKFVNFATNNLKQPITTKDFVALHALDHFLVLLVFRFETAIVRAFHYFCGEYPVEKEDFLCKAYLEPINP